MAIANFTGVGQQTTDEQPLCSTHFTAGLHDHLTFISVLNSFLSITAFLGIALVLIALHKVSSLHPPSKHLLRSLATTDLCVGLISEPLAVTYWMSEVNELWNICRLVLPADLLIGSILCGVSLWTMTAMSVDRLLALLLGLRYRQVVTLKRTYVIFVTIWIVSTVISAIWFWNPVITLWYWIIVIPLCLVTSIVSYTKIFFTLRHYQNQVQNHAQQPNQANQLSIARYKKAVATAIWLQIALVACYLPHGVIVALWINVPSSTVYHAWIYTHTLVYLNSSLNPIIYCSGQEEVRQAVKNTIRQVLCYCFPTQVL